MLSFGVLTLRAQTRSCCVPFSSKDC